MRNAYVRLLFTAILFVSATSCLLAQAITDSVKEDIDKVFTREEVKPPFKGGDKALNNYLTQMVNTIGVEQEEDCIVRFIVSAKGNIYKIEKVSGDLSFEESLENALLKSSGRWNSGVQNKHHVTAYCTLKISLHKNRIKAEIQ
ncbi:MAG: hypothetical protein ABI691_18375 [Ginsengibacter sp.]